MKFVPNYREQWGLVVAKHGLRAVRTATKLLREGKAGSVDATLVPDLNALLRWSPMPLRAPVDPADPKDDGGGLARRTPVRTVMRLIDDMRARDLVRFAERLGRMPRVSPEEPWVAVEINLNYPIQDVARELRELRSTLGFTSVKRSRRRRGWTELEKAFGMRRAVEAKPSVKHLDLARRFLGWDPGDAEGRMPFDVQRTVRDLLKEAGDRITELTRLVELGCPTSEPFIFTDE